MQLRSGFGSQPERGKSGHPENGLDHQGETIWREDGDEQRAN